MPPSIKLPQLAVLRNKMQIFKPAGFHSDAKSAFLGPIDNINVPGLRRSGSTSSRASTGSLPVYAVAAASAYHTMTLRLSITGNVPPMPSEIHAWCDESEYSKRMLALRQVILKFYCGTLIRAYIIAATVITLTAPWPLVIVTRQLILARNVTAIQQSQDRSIPLSDTEFEESDIVLAQLATFGIIIGLLVICWVPLACIRSAGRTALTRLTKQYSNGPTIWYIHKISMWTGITPVFVKIPWKAMQLSDHLSRHSPISVTEAELHAPPEYKANP